MGKIVTRMSYTAFGERRDPITGQGAPKPPNTIATDRAQTYRGYTGQEELDAVGLIHYNGRVYDPRIGRFISADPFVQAPYSSQSLNRYSYAWNDPLKYTDPSGYFVKGCVTVTDGNGNVVGHACTYYPEPSDYALAYTGRGGGSRGGRMDGRRGRRPFVGGYAGGRGNARTMASKQSGNSFSLKVDKKELAKTLGQVLEAQKTGHNVLGKIFSATDATRLSVSLLNTTIQIGLRDIRQSCNRSSFDIDARFGSELATI
jgi:RHS repeat-associated protein